MTTSLIVRTAAICRDRRIELGTTQIAIARALEISRSHYAAIESGRANPSLALVDRIAEVLGVRLDLVARPIMIVPGARVRDALHACCSGYVARRLVADGWVVRREVPIEDGRLRGWIDILAYDPSSGTVLVIEVKTGIEDVGRLERQIGWYERAVASAIPPEWQPRSLASWVLILATAEADQAILQHGDILSTAFPTRALAMRDVLTGVSVPANRGLALIDPRSRRRDWLIATRTDGRRTPIPYQDRPGAMRIIGL
jgi:transcriptional regulator with XRE-family HTH domain